MNMKHHWREASSLILTAFTKPTNKINWNYSLLALKRVSKSSFMPDAYVFPGGVTDPNDDDKKWLDLFKQFGIDYETSSKIKGEIPPIMKETGKIPKLLSLKITAIRETFEETGVLLCFTKNEDFSNRKWTSSSTFDCHLHKWQSKVQNDASEFYNLCQNYNCCPDISNIHLWGNWLTPPHLGGKRFDTIFFIASLEEKPPALADKKEIEELSWISPEELLRSYQRKKILLPPPQVYECSRLLKFQNIVTLNKFAMERAEKGCQRWMPLQIRTVDGLVSILPGDDAYEPQDDFTPAKPKTVEVTIEQFRSQSNVLHRMEFSDNSGTNIIVKNYNPVNGQILPECDVDNVRLIQCC